MVTDRVERTDLALSFPYDVGRGVTTTVADFICLTLTKQAYSILYGSGHYSATVEDSIIDSAECHSIIAAAASRICEELWQSFHRRRPVPVYLFIEDEREAIQALEEFSYSGTEHEDIRSGL